MPDASWMTEDHKFYQKTLNRFFAEEVVPNSKTWRTNGKVDRDFWYRAADLGILGASIPQRYNGLGGDLRYDIVAISELAHTGETSWGFSVHNIVTHYLINCGTEAQRERWLPAMASGERVAAIAMTEPDTGSDLQGIKTTVTENENGFLLNGSKTFITNGQTANLICVVAKNPAISGKNISLFILDTDHATGFTRGRNLSKIGMKGQDTAELFFENVQLPPDCILGGVQGQGFKQLMGQLPWERLMIAIGAVAASDKMLEDTIDYVKNRKAFSQRLMDFQNTRFKLAELKTKVEVTRAFIDRLTEQLIKGKLAPASAAMAKWWSTDVQCQVADECLQLFGGYGYMTEYPIALAYTDARIQKIVGGTNEIQKEIIARSLDV